MGGPDLKKKKKNETNQKSYFFFSNVYICFVYRIPSVIRQEPRKYRKKYYFVDIFQ